MENKPSIFDISFKDHVIWHFAFELCEKIAFEAKDILSQMAPGIYDTNPHQLGSVWDEICTAIYTRDSREEENRRIWAKCEEKAKGVIMELVDALESHHKMAIYWATPDTERFAEETTDLADEDVNADSIVGMIFDENICNMAYDFENDAVYNARCAFDEE